jgi:hypothetical protein
MIRICTWFVAIIALSIAVPLNVSAAANDYSLVIDGETALDRMLPPVAGVIYAPVTDTYKKLGMSASWNPATETATVTGYRMTVELRKDSARARVNGRTVVLPGTVHLRGGKLHFPALASEVLPGIDIRYSTNSRMVYYHVPMAVYLSRLIADPGVKASVNDGAGTLTKQGSMLYEGRLAGGIPAGSGKLYRAGKLIYEGEFTSGMPNGQGTSVDYTGERYEGRFLSGQRDGGGKLYVSGRLTYDGDWKLGLMEGSGIEYGKSGQPVYEGEFAQGKRNGYGVEFDDASGDRIYAGEWLNGKRHGEGKLYDPSTEDLAFIGRFAEGMKEGAGSIITVTTSTWSVVDGNNVVGTETRPTVHYETGTYRADKLAGDVERVTYTGEMLPDGTPHGKGAYYRNLGGKPTSDGMLNDIELLYEGEVKDGKRHGLGHAYDAKKRLAYDGEWKDDLREGFGLAYENGVLSYRGEWRRGFRSGAGTSYEIVKQSVGNTPGEAKLVSGTFSLDKVADSTAKQYVYLGSMSGGAITGRGKLYLVSQNGPTHIRAESFQTGRKGLKVYDGDFVNGLKHGVGIQYIDGLKVYDGNYAKDVYEGYGTMFHGSTGQRAYEGSFKAGEFSGTRGLQYNEAGALIYDGSFDNGLRNGRGTESIGTLRLYEGDFKDGLRHGNGLEFSGGVRVIYDGEYANGKREGWGVEYDQRGVRIYEGLYRNGVRVAAG